MPAIDELAARHWQQVMAIDTPAATLFGWHEHDDRMPPASAAAEAERRAAVVSLLEETAATEVTGDRETVVRDCLVAMLDDELTSLGGADGCATPHAQLRSEQMFGAHQTIIRTMPDLTYPAPEHATALLARLEDVGRYLDESADRLVEALDGGITPVARNVRRVIAQVDEHLARPVEEDDLVHVGGPARWDGEAAWRTALVDALRDHVRPAMRRFRDRFETDLAGHGRDDDHPGLCHVDPSGAVYAGVAKVNTTLDLDPEQVHATGLAHVEGQLHDEWSALGAVTFGESNPRALMDRLRTEPSLRYSSADAVISHAEAALARATGVMSEWFGRLPEADCVVSAIPAHLAAGATAAYYMQPAPDGSRPGTYYVNAHNTESMLRTEGEATAFHEMIPGHHLQLAISGELTGVPDFMRYGTINAYAEGWGLYSERLADEMGLYSSDRDRLGILSLDAFRAGRLVVDTGLHAMGWTRQQAIDWMVAHAPLPIETIETEVDRYIAIPGQALSYKLGQIEIQQLRADAERRLGDRFDIRGFHDAVLGHGMLPLPVLRGVVTRWTDGLLSR